MPKWRQYRRADRVRVIQYDPNTSDAEVGDTLVDVERGIAWRMYTRSHSSNAAAGWLCQCELNRWHPGKRAAIVDGKLVWREASDA